MNYMDDMKVTFNNVFIDYYREESVNYYYILLRLIIHYSLHPAQKGDTPLSMSSNTCAHITAMRPFKSPSLLGVSYGCLSKAG